MAEPIIYSGYEDTGIRPKNDDKFGELGEIQYVTFHHSAGPRAISKERAKQLHRAYQASHIDRGFGDIGYHFSLDDHGRFYRLRSLQWKGAHVGDYNSRNVGIMVHGNYDHDELTEAQHASLRWLFTGGFYKLLNEPEAGISLVRGHKEWPGHYSNACPGLNLMRRISYLRSEEFH